MSRNEYYAFAIRYTGDVLNLDQVRLLRNEATRGVLFTSVTQMYTNEQDDVVRLFVAARERRSVSRVVQALRGVDFQNIAVTGVLLTRAVLPDNIHPDAREIINFLRDNRGESFIDNTIHTDIFGIRNPNHRRNRGVPRIVGVVGVSLNNPAADNAAVGADNAAVGAVGGEESNDSNTASPVSSLPSTPSYSPSSPRYDPVSAHYNPTSPGYSPTGAGYSPTGGSEASVVPETPRSALPRNFRRMQLRFPMHPDDIGQAQVDPPQAVQADQPQVAQVDPPQAVQVDPPQAVQPDPTPEFLQSYRTYLNANDHTAPDFTDRLMEFVEAHLVSRAANDQTYQDALRIFTSFGSLVPPERSTALFGVINRVIEHMRFSS